MDDKIYEKNCKILSEKYPNIYQAIQKGQYEEESVAIGVTMVENRKILFAIQNGIQYQLDSLYDSESLLNTWQESLEAVNFRTCFVWFGMGNGMYMRRLQKLMLKDNSLIVYEPSLSVVAAVIEEFDISMLLSDPRIHVIMPGLTMDFEKVIYDNLDYTNRKYLQYGGYLNYNLIFREEVQHYVDTLQIAISSINSTQSVLERFGEAYFWNSLANLPYLIQGRTLEQLYYALPKDVPAIIVAAGPSLDKNVQELKKAKNRGFVIAVDTAVRALLKQDIIPDLFVTVDGKKLSSHFTDERLRHIPVVCSLQGNKDALGVHSGLKFFFDDENEYIRGFFKKMGREFAGLSTGGSVANDAFSLADTLRFRTIILVGQDLAFTNHMSHASGTVAGELGGDISNADTVKADGYYGGKVLSSTEFTLYRKWFEDIIVEKSYLRVINSTEGGANIKGAENIPLAEAIAQTCTREVDFGKLMEEIPTFFNEEQQKEFVDYMVSSIDRLQELLSDIKRGIRNYEKMELLVYQNKLQVSDMRTLSAQNSEISDKLETEPAMCFVEYRIQKASGEALESVGDESTDERQELLQAVRLGSDYLTKVQNAIEETIPILHKYLVEDSMEDVISKNQAMAEIQGLLGQMQLNVQKAMRCYDE